MERRRLRRLAVPLAVLALLAACILLLWSERLPLAERALQRALEARAGAPVRLAVRELGPSRLRVEGLEVGDPPALRVDQATLRLASRPLLRGRLAAAELRGVRLEGRLSPTGLDLGAAQRLLLGGDEDGAGAPFALPAREVALEDARAELETPWGLLVVEGGLEGREDDAGRLTAQAHGTLHHDAGEAALSVRAEGSGDALEARFEAEIAPAPALPLQLDRPLALEGEAAFEAGALRARLHGSARAFQAQAAGRPLEGRLPALSLEVERPADAAPRLALTASGGGVRDAASGLAAVLEALRLELAGDAETLGGRATLALHDTAEPVRVAPLELVLDLAGAPSAPTLRARVAPPGGEALAQLTAAAALDAGAITATAHLEPVALGSVDLPERVPLLARTLGDALAARGTLEADLRASRDADGALAASADLALRDVGIDTDLARVEGLHGRLELQGLPWHTPGSQWLSMQRLDVGLPLDDGVVELAWTRDGRLLVPQARFRFAGGRVRAGAELGGTTPHGALVFESVDVEELVAQLDVEGLSGTGRLSGALPVFLDDGRLEVRHGALHSDAGGGLLRWRPPGGSALARRPGLDVVLAALEDFHYERVELDLDGDLGGAMDVALHLRGANPNLQGGRPVELNVHVDARLADLVRAGAASYRVPEIVEEHLRAFPTGRKR